MFPVASFIVLVFSGLIKANAELEDGIHVLTDANFDSFIAEHKFAFIEFYAPWCGHCKHLAPILVDVAASLLENDETKDVPVAKVDCTIQKRVCEQYQIQGYPTLKFFVDAKPKDYEGERSQTEIVSFILKKVGPPSKLLTNEAVLNAFLKLEVNRVVAYLSEASDRYALWKEVASTSSLETTCAFAHVDSSLWGDHQEGTVELHVGNDAESSKQLYTYEGAFDADSIWNWILVNGYPLVDTLSQESWSRAQTHPVGKILLTVFYKREDSVPPFVESLAKEYLSKVVFTSSDVLQILDRWGGSGTVLPSAVIINFTGEVPELFTWNEEAGVEFNEEGLKNFIDQSLASEYKTNIKSEPLPEQGDDEHVRIIVAKNFEQIVNDDTKDLVLVEFYAPWCGHCKKLAPIYDELGEHFKDSKNIVIAKIDATANTLPKDLQVAGYPTLISFAKGVRHVYTGAHDLESLITFVKTSIDPPAEETDREDL